MKNLGLSVLALCSFSVNASDEKYQVIVDGKNDVVLSNGVKVFSSDTQSLSDNFSLDNVTILSGKEAMLVRQQELEKELSVTAKMDTIRSITESARALEELVFIDSMLINHSNMEKTTIYGIGDHCGTNTFLNFSFQDSFYRFNLSVEARTGTVGPYPPNTPTQFVTSKAQVTQGGTNHIDTDSATATSLFVSTSSLIGSGLHGDPLPFEATGNYYAYTNQGCSNYKVISVTGTYAWTDAAPTIDNIIN